MFSCEKFNNFSFCLEHRRKQLYECIIMKYENIMEYELRENVQTKASDQRFFESLIYLYDRLINSIMFYTVKM